MPRSGPWSASPKRNSTPPTKKSRINQPPAATRRTVKAQGGAERNPGVSPPYRPRPNGADGTDEGSFCPRQSAVPCAPSGRGARLGSTPRVAPWAVAVGPVGAGTLVEHSLQEEAQRCFEMPSPERQVTHIPAPSALFASSARENPSPCHEPPRCWSPQPAGSGLRPPGPAWFGDLGLAWHRRPDLSFRQQKRGRSLLNQPVAGHGGELTLPSNRPIIQLNKTVSHEEEDTEESEKTNYGLSIR
jgi:hypothetical protein